MKLPGDGANLHQSELLGNRNDSAASYLLEGLYDGSLKEPARAIKQVFGQRSETLEHKQSEDTPSYRTGKIIGSLLPYAGLALASRKAGAFFMGESSTLSTGRVMAEQGAAGFLQGALFTPSELKPGQSLLSSRLEQGAISATTFALMSGTAQKLDRVLPVAGEKTLPTVIRRASIGFASGMVGGAADIEMRSGFKAAPQDLLINSLGYAGFGSLMEAGLSGRAVGQLRQKPLEFNAARSLAADAGSTIINSHNGWYDRLQRTIYKASPDHTIVVTEPKWLQAAEQIKKSARRPDVKVFLDSAAVESKAVPANETLPQPKESIWNIQGRNISLREAIQKEIEGAHENPADAITKALKSSRVVMIGEYHVSDSIHRDLGASLMPKFKEAGLTHLAIEHSKDFKGKIFDASGKLDLESLPELLRDREFVDLLDAARKAEIDVVPVDSPLAASRDLSLRNKEMETGINELLKDPKNKIVFWVGNRHLSMKDATGEGPQVAELLRKSDVPVTTFYARHDNFWREEPLREIYSPEKAVAVPTKSTPKLSELNWLHRDELGHAIHSFSEFDYLLLYPKQDPTHWD